MKDYLAQVEKLRKDAGECALIGSLAISRFLRTKLRWQYSKERPEPESKAAPGCSERKAAPHSIRHKLHTTEALNLLSWPDMQDRTASPVHVTSAQCRQLAGDYKNQAREVGISQRRATLLTNIARSFSGLANQLEMLAVDVAEQPSK